MAKRTITEILFSCQPNRNQRVSNKRIDIKSDIRRKPSHSMAIPRSLTEQRAALNRYFLKSKSLQLV